ncbi:DUF302 domain-containing protein [Shewanella ulleungensis]|uniref:DUF302 domain-containing protein n=1 Tax=Shewanella ulleungensis TaxID=2282699 RepID=A0ABQ2QCP7_9GAMM|nr:DUF302 domain-containing protein [Shewanella ulleungensis]MCL1148728.1 DUF302 domain-containing protein [Shewanella ulleungensis]GGP75960.1 hypothetical protein GCM10009410_05350 [Shewanella ulleungensis]
MIKNLTLAITLFFTSTSVFTTASVFAVDSLITHQSQFSPKITADRFESIIKDKGFTVFARIDHQKNAEGVELSLPATEVIIFGNPKIGTQLMQCNQQVAIDLPQKVLITEDAHNKVWLSYNNPQYLKQRHDIKGCDAVLDKISTVLESLSKAATTQSKS